MTASLPEAWLVDAIVVLVVVEGVILVAYRARTGGGLPVAGTLANLSSGAALLLALRVALSDASATAVLALLSVALIAHVADLASRWEAASPRYSARPDASRLPVISPPDSFSAATLNGSQQQKIWRAGFVKDCHGRRLPNRSTLH
jgi:hypothetical protein